MALSTPDHRNPATSGIEDELAVIEVRAVTKQFHFYEHRTKSLREHFVRTASRQSRGAQAPHFSLSDVSLTARRGETWAVIGRNGAGKSTLLRLMAGIYWPSTGEVITRGRLATVMELGAGFHPELTGSENVQLYWAILGLARSALSQHYGAIVEFAGIPDFMDTPVKYYSSGMRARLAFAAATAVPSEILLLDEILAVGDAEFRDRSLRRLRALQAAGCTLVFAAHDLELTAELATQAVWLDRGRVQSQGPARQVIANYQSMPASAAVAERAGPAAGRGIVAVELR